MWTQILLAALCATAIQASIEGWDSPDRIPGEYIVTLHAVPGSKMVKSQYIENFIAKVSSAGIRVARRFIIHDFLAVEVHSDSEVAVDSLNALPEVELVQANLMLYATQCGGPSSSLYWGLERSATRSGRSPYTADLGVNSASATVYILDTGIRYDHEDFGGRAFFGFTAFNDGDGPDIHGHGTHCAGTSNGINSGISKNLHVFNVKVLGNNGSGSTTGIVNGLQWVVDHNRSNKVASMSLGGGSNPTLDNACNNAVSAGVHVVVAAGNSNANACNFSPAGASLVFTVGSTQESGDSRSSFSNWGTCVDIFAPGSSIRSANNNSPTGYVNMSGTSMACPHVAGAVARYLSEVNPGASPAAAMAWVKDQSTKGVVGNPGTGSPNELLYAPCPL